MELVPIIAASFVGWIAVGCGRHPDLVVYCSLDQEFAEPLIRLYEQETGLRVRAEFDIEANKTVGLVQRIREERAAPRCDVLWSNEIAHTVALGQDGFLARYDSPSAADIPANFRDPDRRWTGFAARARVFIVNTDLARPEDIRGMWDLVDPKWHGKVAIARPIAGTTLTHIAALYCTLGAERAGEYVARIDELSRSGGVHLANGNSSVARLVGDGALAFGWTDTDDFAVTRERGAHVALVVPDADGCGTLLLPNTIAILAGTKREAEARRFVDWVLRPETEERLAFSRSEQIPVRASVRRPPQVAAPGALHPMLVDWNELGRSIEERAASLKTSFVQ
ncbi:MAG: extracellular solute-binding protein [Planctomycetes bacterium]|nr:extracellular solute-binding protein [Planctomycetota bacterium]